MRGIALAGLLGLACQGKGDSKPPEVTVTLEPTAAADAAIGALGKLLQPSAPVMGFAEIRPHLGPLAADCKKGSDLACAVFANLYRYGALVARKAPPEEVARVDEACGKGEDPAACALAGEAHHDAAKGRQAGEIFALACAQGIAEGCAIGDDPGPLGRACDLGEFASCEALVGKDRQGRARIARGLAIFQAACARRHHPSCNAARALGERLAP